MLVPGAARKALLIAQSALAFDELTVQCVQRLQLTIAQGGLLLRQSLAVVVGAACQCLASVLHGREVQVRWNLLLGGRNRGEPGIERRFEDALLQFFVALANFFLFIGQ